MATFTRTDLGFIREHAAKRYEAGYEQFVRVYCRSCHGSISYYHYNPPHESSYSCGGCSRSLFESQVNKLKDSDLNERFYVEAYALADHPLSKLDIRSSGDGKTHLYTRPMSNSERLDYYRAEMRWKIANGKV